MDLSKSREWSENDLEALIANQVKESINLDYKSCPSLQKKERNRDEISKDVSAFANSGGGIIVYGMVETDHIPTAIDNGYDPTDITREWLEQVIQGNIRPRINDVHINQVTLTKSGSRRVAYVVTIPQGVTAHQAADRCYYKRFNFKSEAMHDHELRDVMNRLKYPLIIPMFTRTPVHRSDYDFQLHITLVNSGAMRAKDIKLVFFWPDVWKYEQGGSFHQRIIMDEITWPGIKSKNVELVVPETKKIIFPEDQYRLTEEEAGYDFKYSDFRSAYGEDGSPKPRLVWRVYADDMPPQNGFIHIVDIPFRPD